MDMLLVILLGTTSFVSYSCTSCLSVYSAMITLSLTSESCLYLYLYPAIVRHGVYYNRK